jgi:AcrR family transcriptional regulator
MLDVQKSETKLRAVNTIEAYLDELRAARPTIAFGNLRSTKGAETAASILRAARQVFIEDGHAGLTLRKVAKEAGLAVGNVSYYFASKRDLIEAMLREELTDYVEEHIKQFEAGRDAPLDILLNVVTFYVANGRLSHRFFYQMWGYAGSDPAAKSLIRELYRPIGRFIYYLVKAANPSLGDADVRRVVLQLFSLEEGVKLFMGMGPDDDPALKTAERDIRELARRIVEGF